ncbi:MAG: hypothetical protein ACXADL_02290 [Candidatus Thorarchaeota archaeon]
MDNSERKRVLRDSLTVMRKSLMNTYDLRTTVSEESRLLKAWGHKELDYVVFSDYRRNDGSRRMADALDIIDSALDRLEHCDARSASKLYFETLKTVALFSKWATVLETSASPTFFEKEEERALEPSA